MMKRYTMRSINYLFVLVILNFAVSQSAFASAVDVELALLVDTSGSVSLAEFDLQRQGYELAFENAGIQAAISNGSIGSIAVTLIYWSTNTSAATLQALPWTQITTAADANAFGAAIGASSRPFSAGNTAPGSALNFAVPLFTNNFEGTRKVIDISGDGVQNAGLNLATERANALQVVDTINGLPIGGQDIVSFYTNSLIGGTNAFVVPVSSYSDVQDAILLKLKGDITGVIPSPVPVPAAAWLFISGLIGLSGLLKRTKN